MRTIPIHAVIPNNKNLRQKYAEKIWKYWDLELWIKWQWGMSSTGTTPILISITGIILKSHESYLEELDLDENLYKVLLGTAGTVKKFVWSNTYYQGINREIHQDQETKNERPRTQEKKNTEYLRPQSP